MTNPQRPLIVGVAGQARAGKDTLINGIVAGFGPGEVYVTQWADGVKAAAMLMFGLNWDQVQGLNGFDRDAPYFADGRSVRDALVAVGMMGRDFDPDTWVRATMNAIIRTLTPNVSPNPRLVLISGTRFPNEAAACDEVWWVDRPDLPYPEGVSETSLTRKSQCVKRVFLNGGTPGHLAQAGVAFANALLAKWEGRA